MREDEPCTTQGEGYAIKVYTKIRKRWFRCIPREAQRGLTGAVRLHFYIARDGQIRDLETVRHTGPDSMEAAAQEAVRRASPLPEPQFKDLQCEQVGVTFNFFYNLGPVERQKWQEEPS